MENLFYHFAVRCRKSLPGCKEDTGGICASKESLHLIPPGTHCCISHPGWLMVCWPHKAALFSIVVTLQWLWVSFKNVRIKDKLLKPQFFFWWFFPFFCFLFYFLFCFLFCFWFFCCCWVFLFVCFSFFCLRSLSWFYIMQNVHWS